MSSCETKEHLIILQVICLLYREHYAHIRELKSLSYWIRLISCDDYEHCRFMLLQLVHICLSVNN